MFEKVVQIITKRQLNVKSGDFFRSLNFGTFFGIVDSTMFGRVHASLVKFLVPVFLHAFPFLATRSDGNCLIGGFFFAVGRNMLDNHALLGHVFKNATVREPIKCFEKCQTDCRCISFNYMKTANEDNCQLNDENKNTKSNALRPKENYQYYDLIIDYNIKVRT